MQNKARALWKFLINHIYWFNLVLVQLILILLCLMYLSDTEITKLYYNIDYLYLASLYTDLFVDGNNLASWSLTPNPYFFPDMPLYFIVYSCAKHPGYAILFFSMIQLLIIEFCFYRILQLMLEDVLKARIYFVWSTLFLQLFLIAGAFGREAFMGHLLLTSSSHLGAVICSLLSILCFLKYWKSGKIVWMVSLFLLIIVSLISDRIYLVQTIAPLILGSIIILFSKRKWVPILVVMVGATIGWFSFQYLSHTLQLVPDVSNPPLSFKQSLQNFIDAWNFISKHYTAGRFIIYIHLVLLILSPLGMWRFRQGNRIGYILLISSAFLSFAFPIYYGFFQAIDTYRYIMQSYIFILLLAPIIVPGLLKIPWMKNITAVVSFIYLSYVLYVAYYELDFKRLDYFIAYKEGHVKLVENNRDKLKNGIADYWHAKDVYALVGNRNRVVSVRPDFEAYLWQENRIWYTGEKNQSPPIFNFTINLRPDSILGPPLDSINGGDNMLFIYSDFGFKKAEDGRTTIFRLSK